jgi:hypothetical protein
MKIRDILASYVKSPLAAISAGACLVLGSAALFALGSSLLLGLAVGSVAWAVFSAVVIQTKIGAMAVVSVRSLDEVKKTQAAIIEAARNGERIARLRLPDPEVAKTVEYLALCSGEYVEACQKAMSHSPAADERIADSLDLINIFLKELDEASTEKRYRLPDADPFADAKGRVQSALMENARLIREERIRLDGGLPAEALMRAKEELR